MKIFSWHGGPKKILVPIQMVAERIHTRRAYMAILNISILKNKKVVIKNTCAITLEELLSVYKNQKSIIKRVRKG